MEHLQINLQRNTDHLTSRLLMEKQLHLNSLEILPPCESVSPLFLTAFYAYSFKRPTWRWGTVAVGTAFAGHTAYANLLRKDPLVEAFYKIVGGRDKFDALPVCTLESQHLTSYLEDNHKKNWSRMLHPMYRAETADGRKILFIKAAWKGAENTQSNTILVYVEKLGYNDAGAPLANMSAKWGRLFMSTMHALCFPMQNNFKYDASSVDRGGTVKDVNCKILASIPADVANEFAAQSGFKE